MIKQQTVRGSPLLRIGDRTQTLYMVSQCTTCLKIKVQSLPSNMESFLFIKYLNPKVTQLPLESDKILYITCTYGK